MVRAVLREYNAMAHMRVGTEAGPGFVMLDSNGNEAVDRAMKAGVTWLLRYEMTRIQEGAPSRGKK
jgi:hypothetical protein